MNHDRFPGFASSSEMREEKRNTTSFAGVGVGCGVRSDDGCWLQRGTPYPGARVGREQVRLLASLPSRASFLPQTHHHRYCVGTCSWFLQYLPSSPGPAPSSLRKHDFKRGVYLRLRRTAGRVARYFIGSAVLDWTSLPYRPRVEPCVHL